MNIELVNTVVDIRTSTESMNVIVHTHLAKGTVLTVSTIYSDVTGDKVNLMVHLYGTLVNISFNIKDLKFISEAEIKDRMIKLEPPPEQTRQIVVTQP